MKITSDFLRQVIRESLEEMGQIDEAPRQFMYVITDSKGNLRFVTDNYERFLAAKEELEKDEEEYQPMRYFTAAPNSVLNAGEANENY